MDDLEKQLRDKVREVDAAQKALDALRDEEQALRDALHKPKKFWPGYMMRLDDPRMSEPLWLIATQTAWGKSAWMGFCPIEWMTLEQRKIAGADVGEVNFNVLQVAFSPDEFVEGTIYYDKPVAFFMEHLTKEIPITHWDVPRNGFIFDMGYVWDFKVDWQVE